MMKDLPTAEILAALAGPCSECAEAKAKGLLVSDGAHFVPDETDELGGYVVDCPRCIPIEQEARRRGIKTRGFFGERIQPLDDAEVTIIAEGDSE